MKRKLTALLLVLALLCTFVTPVIAGDNWWEEYVTNPMDDITITGIRDDGTVETEGNYILFTSDVHRYAYLAKDLLEAANDAITDGGKVGLFAFGGDFANEYVLYESNMSIIKAAVGDTPATYTKGNHEGSTSDEEFQTLTGMSRIGETAINKDGDYYFYNFGAYDKNQAFQADEIEELAAWLEDKNDGKPIFIVSHYPLHYYNDRRSSKLAADVLELLNNYPQVTFLWGHNHTEADPNYGMIRTPGDIIQTGATADTSVEIKFTYACLGACRDGWNGANGLLAEVNGTEVTFRYIALNNAMSTESWTDAQGNENTIRVPQSPGVSSTTVVETAADFNTISLANVQIDRPLAAQEPATMASEYSERFSASEITWDAGTTFDFGTAYTATFTLTAEEGYTFASNAVVSVNKEYIGPMPGQENHEATVTVSEDGKTATVSYTFPATVAKGEPIAAATEIEEGATYVIASTDNYAAYYQYDASQHGEESMPDYAVASADVVIADGKLISAVDGYTVFAAQKDANGYLLWSAESAKAYGGDAVNNPDSDCVNFLTMSTRGGDLGLEAAVSAGNTIYTNWNLNENGVPYLDIDGANKYLTYNGGFVYTDDASESNVRLYKVGTTDGTIYNVPVTVTAPVAGEAASTEATTAVGTASAAWEVETFDYGTEYTVTVTVTPNGAVDEDLLTARVNGNTANAEVVDGKIVITYTFGATAKVGAATVATGKAVDSITSDGYYVIAVGDKAMTINPDGIYQASTAVEAKDGKITSKITTDMIFTLSGNAEDGYTLKNGNQYLAGRSVDDSPDVWGFTTTTDASKAVTFNYVDGKLEVVSTGATSGPGGPPPGGDSSTSYLYENDGHFNFSAYNTSDITLYELSVRFTDVKGWAQKYVVKATMLGIMNGDSAKKFLPDNDMTRAEAITVLYRMAGSPEVTGTTKFVDLESGRFYEKAVIWGQQNGIINGTDKTHFSPNKAVTREMFASMVARFLEYKGFDVTGDSMAFKDIDAAHNYAKADIDTCAKAGIINGDPDGSFRPRDNILRKEAAKMLVCLNELLG